MLKSLLIKDYALIDNLSLEFGAGLNILTGETGAGKSILIGAMGLLLGDRASTDVIRKEAKKSVVEGIFDVSRNKKVDRLLREHDLDTSDELIIRREISLKGSNRCFLNDTPVTLAQIKEVGNLLVDLHGQHEHQSLLRQELHIEMLDEFAELDDEVAKYRASTDNLTKKMSSLSDLLKREKELKERKEIVEFQIKEIDEVNPVPGEEEDLQNELNVLDNAENLIQLTENVYSGLYDSENSISDMLGHVKSSIQQLADIDKEFGLKVNEADEALSLINELASFVRSYKDNVELDPARLEEVRERLGTLNLIKKRYGGSIEAVIKLRKELGDEFEMADNFSEKISQLQDEIEQLRGECSAMAQKLSKSRIKSCSKVTKEVESALQYLGFDSASFVVENKKQLAREGDEHYLVIENEKCKFNKNGIDRIEFYLAANKGEDAKPLVKVASGGEVSRIMLALKTILARNDKLPVLIFDEIDIGVSGRIAQKVGNSLKALSEYHQLIVITHLPQIASLSDTHYSITKSEIEGRVVTRVQKLNNEERVVEIAKLLSGEEVTEAGLSSARELIHSKN